MSGSRMSMEDERDRFHGGKIRDGKNRGSESTADLETDQDFRFFEKSSNLF